MTSAVKQVREIALENPASSRVFEQYGIDYCCGGHRPLADACQEKGVAVSAVLEAIEKLSSEEPAGSEVWAARSLAELAEHIVWKHHNYIRKEFPRLQQLAEKVVARHGGTRSELAQIQNDLEALGEELLQHIHKEELVLFPYISKLEAAYRSGGSRPYGCFGSILQPIEVMLREHDSAGQLSARIRELSADFNPPEGACPTYHAYYSGLREFIEDLHRHIHLENNILFPRAIEMERGEA